MGAILVTILDAVTRWAAAPILLDVNLIVVLGESRRVLFFARTGIARQPTSDTDPPSDADCIDA